VPFWHPILAAVEVELGHWRMVAQYGHAYGDVRFDGTRYSATDLNGVQLGPFTSLRDATVGVKTRPIRRRCSGTHSSDLPRAGSGRPWYFAPGATGGRYGRARDLHSAIS
jgi:hypothetical protein